MASRKENVSNGYGSAKAAVADLHEETCLTQPKPARSAFMCFSDAKQKEWPSIKKKELIRRVAEAWRALTPKERAFWDEEARNDKLRFVRQKQAYKGPWEVPKRRAKKHPLAPKRPMSAFLKYSKEMRKQAKRQNPDMANTDVSRLLGEMWRNASTKEKAPYVEEELRERAVYKKDIALFKAKQAQKDVEDGTSHEDAQRMNEAPTDVVREDERSGGSFEDTTKASSVTASDQRAAPRFYHQEYRTDQIAPVASTDSHSLHEHHAPNFDHYSGPHFVGRGHPPVGTVTFSLSDPSDGEQPPLSRERSSDSMHSAGYAQPLLPPFEPEEYAVRSRYFNSDGPRYYARYP